MLSAEARLPQYPLPDIRRLFRGEFERRQSRAQKLKTITPHDHLRQARQPEYETSDFDLLPIPKGVDVPPLPNPIIDTPAPTNPWLRLFEERTARKFPMQNEPTDVLPKKSGPSVWDRLKANKHVASEIQFWKETKEVVSRRVYEGIRRTKNRVKGELFRVVDVVYDLNYAVRHLPPLDKQTKKQMLAMGFFGGASTLIGSIGAQYLLKAVQNLLF